MKIQRAVVELRVTDLYRIKAAAYADEFGMTVRGAQKAFKRMHEAEKKVPLKYGAYAGLPLVEHIGTRLFMLEPYFDAIRVKRVRV